MEQYITVPIESAMNGTAGVKGVRSSSGSGLSFMGGFRLEQRYLPGPADCNRTSWSSPGIPAGRDIPGAGPHRLHNREIAIALTGDKDTSQLDMRQLAEYKLRTRLLAISGWGGSRCWAGVCRNTR
ncbi:MAG: hypothetical protein ACLT38_10295 [Akkermansia sp.]